MMHVRRFVLSMMLMALAATGCALHADTAEHPERTALIQSIEDLNDHLQSTADSPLHRLSPAARQRFVDSLVFGENGLGGYQYADLEAELTASEIYDVLALFGAERTTSMITGARITNAADEAIMQMRRGDDDHKGYKCSGPGSCYTDTNSICTSNC